jgi:hypothetical protein
MRRERVADLGTQRQRIAAPRYPKVTPMDPIRRPVHPRIQRRRDLAASVHIPPELGAKFTEGEIAVVKIISGEIVKHGSCTLTIDAIADRQAWLLHVDHRRYRRPGRHQPQRGEGRAPHCQGGRAHRGRAGPSGPNTITLSKPKRGR